MTLGLASVAVSATVTAVRALPPPEAPRNPPTATPFPSPTPTFATNFTVQSMPRDAAHMPTLPVGSSLVFVLDEKINSGNARAGSLVRMHLRDPLVVNGVVLAPAGTADTLSIVSVRKAGSLDTDGSVQIFLEPLAIAGTDRTVPLRASREYLAIEHSAGQLTTRGLTDSIIDVFVPYHQIYEIVRKGHQMVLPAGSLIRAQIADTIDAHDPHAIVLQTPAPLVSNPDAPHADLTPAPLYTPAPERPHPRRGKPTLPPKGSPAPAASPAASPVVPSPAAASPGAASPTAVPPPQPSAGPSDASPHAARPSASPT